MRAMFFPCWGAAILTACHPASAKGAAILSELDGSQDNAAIAEIQAHNAGGLCSIVASDGTARLMSFGQQAVVDVGGKPAVLTYQQSGGNQASFTGMGIRISGDLVRQNVKEFGKTSSHDVTVKVQSDGRVENIQAKWTCQKAMVAVRSAR